MDICCIDITPTDEIISDQLNINLKTWKSFLLKQRKDIKENQMLYMIVDLFKWHQVL